MKSEIDLFFLGEEMGNLIEHLKTAFGDDFIALALFGSLARGEGDERSDLDIFCIIDNLPGKIYERKKLLSKIITKHIQRRFSIIAKTHSEFLDHFSSLYLDLGLDAKIIYDRDDFLKKKLKRIRNILEKAGLKRERDGRDFFWNWKTTPSQGWEIDWQGYRELEKRRTV
jgi:predicted nucleotidyltransferase